MTAREAMEAKLQQIVADELAERQSKADLAERERLERIEHGGEDE